MGEVLDGLCDFIIDFKVLRSPLQEKKVAELEIRTVRWMVKALQNNCYKMNLCCSHQVWSRIVIHIVMPD